MLSPSSVDIPVAPPTPDFLMGLRSKQDTESQDVWQCSPSPLIALCMYGLVRSAYHTQPSLLRHLRQPLGKVGGTDLFIHALLMPATNNPRAGEANVLLSPGSFLELGPACRYSAEDQDTFDASSTSICRLPQMNSRSFPSSYSVHTMKNLIRSLHSKQSAVRMAMAHEVAGGFTYRLLALARQDTAFLTAVPAGPLHRLMHDKSAQTVLVPVTTTALNPV